MVLVRQRFWGKTLADGLVDLPFAVSPIIAGLMLVIVYGPARLDRPLAGDRGRAGRLRLAGDGAGDACS